MSVDVFGEASRLLSQAMRHHNDGDLTEAERVYLLVLEIGYREIDISRLLGGICFETRRYGEAEIHWRRVLAAIPGDVATLTGLAAVGYLKGRPADAVEWLLAVEAIEPEHPFVVANLGPALLDAGRRDEAVGAFRRAVRSRPDDPLVRHRLKRAISAIVPYWHIPMMNDAPRNQAFCTAIARAVARHGQGAHVLEIGTGAGLLALMAAQAGAGSVDTCEAVATIAEAARVVIAQNGQSNRINVIGKTSQDLRVGVDVAEPADILISEILSSDVLTEGVLPSFEDAVSRLVKPGGTVIPSAVAAVGCLVGGPGIERMVHVLPVTDFDLIPFSALAPQRIPITTAAASWTRLSDDHELVRFDLTAGNHPPGWWEIQVPVTADGTVAGVLQWMNIELDAETSFTTHPQSYSEAGWTQIVHALGDPIPVRKGDILRLLVGHDRTSLLVQLAGSHP